MTLFILLSALALFFGLAALFARLFADPLAPYPPRTRRTLALSAAAGLVGSLIWGGALPGSLGWDAPALAIRLAGAMALAAVAVLVTIMRAPSLARIRFGLGTVATGLAPMLVLLGLFHRPIADWSSPVPWVLALLSTVLSVWAVLEMLKSKDLRKGRTPPATERGLWAAMTTLAGVLAALWMLWPWGTWSPLWPFAGVAGANVLAGSGMLVLFMMGWMARNRTELGRPAAIGHAVFGGWGLGAVALAATQGTPVPPALTIALACATFLGLWRALRR
ncbi:hypothetical protein JI664_06155 [Rhodobacter sp. NTK016B]|uniref:hypothetical protein n=1 Tax=Rhodobacter sp. NTK016B TaxID=2759676 RepID=UPI001A8F4B07|nr:hypothetical protein [Rhodobacter sp. NTK016B]MBN8291537.1 hypothetical protein [Rhodobacter sp. NTK016B]